MSIFNHFLNKIPHIVPDPSRYYVCSMTLFPFEKLLNFWLFFELLLETKIAPKSHQNGGQNRLQDAFQGAWKRKWWKCDFEQHYSVLARFWGSPRLGNPRKNGKNLTKIASNFQETLEIDFGWILGGFWRPSWRQNRIKIGWKFDWKFWLKKDRQNEPR